MSALVAKQIGELVSPIVSDAIKELRGIIDEVGGGEERRELALKSLDKLETAVVSEYERDAAIYKEQISLLRQEAVGQDKIQRTWRPWSAVSIVATTLVVLFCNLVVFPIMQVIVPTESWGLLQSLVLAVFTLLGVQVAGRSFEKTRGIDAIGRVLDRPLPRDTKADTKAFRQKLRALRKAGLTEDQIMEVLKSEEE